MSRPPKLTDHQKEQLKILEPALRNAVKLGQYQQAKKVTSKIQKLLRPTGHETRLMKSKNWLFEAAMEAGELNKAESGFIGIRKKMNKRTRIYLEATALLAVCYLRKDSIDKAEPLMEEVLQNKHVIRSDRTRKQFKLNVIQRFEEEAALANLRNQGAESLDVDEVQNEAGTLVQSSTTDEELYRRLGHSLPKSVSHQILRIEKFAQKKLPAHEFKFLPDPQEKIQDEEVGKTVFSSLKRVIWRSLCDKESDIYKAWYNNGMAMVLDKKYLTTVIVTSISGMGIGIKALAVSAAALVIKLGIEVYCDRYKPAGIMDARVN